MDSFAKKEAAERRNIFQEAASRRDVLPIVIEKDFWVCWTLKRVFTAPQLAPYITFKGGTSLSKSYGLIERFSEDIDLTISREASPLNEVKDPLEGSISGKERGRRIEALKESAQRFVGETILGHLTAQMTEALESGNDWQLLLDPDDPDRQTILFYYPQTTTETAGYVKPTIKLEFGARGGTEPQNETPIRSYVSEEFPALFPEASCSPVTLSVTRSFWEKATILHALCHGSKMKDRMSRHYYDTFMMDQKGVTEAALTDTALLDLVVQNKTYFFRDPKASYDTAKIGTLRLVPEGETLLALKKDYKAMEEMFMADAPGFDDIIERLILLEQKINATK